MRQSRIKVSRENKGKKFGFIIILASLFPLAIMLGYVFTKYYILPNVFSNEVINEKHIDDKKAATTEVKQNEESKAINETTQEAYVNTFEIQGFDIFSIQVGNFTTKENANELVKELNNQGMGAYIWYNNGYKVMTISILDRESIDTIMPSIKQKYDEAFVATRSIPNRAIKYGKEDSEYAILLENQNKKLIEVFEKLSGIIKKSKNDLMDMDECNALIKKYIGDLKNIQDELKKENPSKHMQPIHNEFIKIVDYLIEELDVHVDNDAKLFIQIQNIFMRGLYQYSDLVTKNAY